MSNPGLDVHGSHGVPGKLMTKHLHDCCPYIYFINDMYHIYIFPVFTLGLYLENVSELVSELVGG